MSFSELYLNRRIQLELLPAIVFFVVNFGWGLMAATAAVIVATIISLAIGQWSEGRTPVLAVVTLVLVLGLGGASLVFRDETFIKMKPTLADCLFATALAVGLAFRPSFLVRALGTQVDLTEQGWLVLTLCWISFTLVCAISNEAVWRTMTTDQWVTFKTVMTPVSILGYVIITRLIAGRYWRADSPWN